MSNSSLTEGDIGDLGNDWRCCTLKGSVDEEGEGRGIMVKEGVVVCSGDNWAAARDNSFELEVGVVLLLGSYLSLSKDCFLFNPCSNLMIVSRIAGKCFSNVVEDASLDNVVLRHSYKSSGRWSMSLFIL